MSAFLIGHITVKDPEPWASYIEGVRKTLIPFAAEVLFRGRLTEILAGDLPYKLTVVIRFADDATLQAWFHSDDYQALIPIRDRAADVTIAAYEELQ